MNHRDTESQRTNLNDLSGRVIGLAIEVHRELGPGLLESAYEAALAYELTQAGIEFQRQLDLPLLYKGLKLDCGYRLDFVIENSLVVELTAVSEILPIHTAQVLTYLKLQHHLIGLLINFNVPVLKEGIRRVVAGSLFKNQPTVDTSA